jgi:hypothetical protein
LAGLDRPRCPRSTRCDGDNQASRLTLYTTRVSDVGLAQLKGLARLEELSINGTEVTEAGKEDLLKALLKLTIRR